MTSRNSFLRERKFSRELAATDAPPLTLVEPLGRGVWRAEGEGGALLVKERPDPQAAAGEPWRAGLLHELRQRGHRIPDRLWYGPLPGGSFAVVDRWVDADPLVRLDAATVEELLALVELQADVEHPLGHGFDVSEWISLVLFDGWEGWWDAAQSASRNAAELCERLRRLVEPVRHRRLPVRDAVHHDLNVSNVLVADGAIAAVVDWDALGLGSRALDVAALLAEWHRLRIADPASAAEGGDVRLLERLERIDGDDGLRLAIGYRCVAVLGVSAGRDPPAAFARHERTVAALLESIRV